MADAKNELFFEQARHQTQLVYFLLGLAASAIAFAVHETSDKSLAETPWPLGVGVVLWGASFVSGTFSLGRHHKGLIRNAVREEMKDEFKQILHAPEVQQGLADSKDRIMKEYNAAFRYRSAQLWTMFAGAIFYVAGHVMAMAHVPSKRSAGDYPVLIQIRSGSADSR